ncbi:MAG: 2-hydroxyacid dehydrogenase [Thermomicrobiales bacterium]
MPTPLLVIIDISPEAQRLLESLGFDVHLAGALGGRTAAVQRVPEARAVLTNGSLGLTSDEITALSNLEIICAIGAGFEMIDVTLASQRGIVVTNGAGTNASAVADHAMTLLLAIAGTIVPSNAAVRRGEWSNFSSPQRDVAQPGERTDFPFKRVGVSGKKLGILGLGVIGNLIAHRAADGFDMEVAYHNRRQVESAPYRYIDSLGELAAWADFLILSAPGGQDSWHIVGADVLDRLGPAGYLVNIGRGTVVDTEALVTALTERRIAGAALDVVEGEPDIPAPLLTIDNLLLTPHMAGRTPEAITAMVDLAAENLSAHFRNEPVRNRVN